MSETLQALAAAISIVGVLLWIVSVVGPAPLHDDPDDEDQ